ncbi:MAG: ABC-F family ATP-binding cassette domain-containing protein [Clostridia bacterium]|nr:ABC-F family ATP-binding cassette domain-containing protein [Clostridia bacterium]
MLTVNDVSLQFAGSLLYKHVDLIFQPGHCYGIIGANGAGKSTLLNIISGKLQPTTGSVSINKEDRMSVLEQDHFKYDDYTVMDTVIMGNRRLYDIMKEKEALYMKEDFTDEDGERAALLEGEFAEMDGWNAEPEADQLLNGLGIPMEMHYAPMNSLDGRQKVKVLLAQALFGHPNIILLDEPTNGLDVESTDWLEEFLVDCEAIVIVVSHDRHFLNAVCTNIVDVDHCACKMYAGNYDFWYESSKLMQNLIRNQNKKREEKIRDLQEFIRRFAANKSKSKQATSRKKILDSIQIEQMPASSRKYPFVGFEPEREAGKDILFVEGLTKTIDGVKVLDNVSFVVNKGDKIAFVGDNENGATALFRILTGEMNPDSGTFRWGVTMSQSYFPKDNTRFFEGYDGNLIEWLSQFSQDTTETYLRGFLGRMLFSGDEVYKPAKVLSGGEKVRCMLSRLMLSHANALILDQPTDHLDLESITALSHGLQAYPGNLFFACHDHQFIDEVANRVIEIPLGQPGCLDRAGTFEEFLEWKRNRG